MILIRGEVSVIELPRSSILALTVSSSSLTAASSLVRVLICSEFPAYSSCFVFTSSCFSLGLGVRARVRVRARARVRARVRARARARVRLRVTVASPLLLRREGEDLERG